MPIKKPAPLKPFAQCETTTASTSSPIHLRPITPPAPLFHGGGIPTGTTALCGRDMSRGWDLERTMDSADVQRALDFRASHPNSPGLVCTNCAQTALTTTP